MQPGAVLRVARPTDHLAAITEMYATGLDFTILAQFEDHDGFDGIILGHPQQPYHLEFTTQRGHQVGRAPMQDHLLVFSLPDHDDGFQTAVWESRTWVCSTTRIVRYRLGGSTERLRSLQRGSPITRSPGGTLCHLFASLLSLLEDGYPLLQVPHVRFERVQCCDHQCLDDRCI